MEMFEIRYFHAVAELGSIIKASQKLNISAPAISKAISRLELELGIDLFYKDGRSIKLTPNGSKLKSKALEMLELEKNIKSTFNSTEAEILIRIAGPEVLLRGFSLSIISTIKKKYPRATFQFMDVLEGHVKDLILSGRVDVGLQSFRDADLKSTILGEATFHTYVGDKHDLYRAKNVNVRDLLLQDFAIPASDLLGSIPFSSIDGWREDKFPRKAVYKDVGIPTLGKLVEEGLAVTYLPDYLGAALGLKKLNVSGCPFKCQQKIYYITKHEVADWLF